MKDFFLPDIQGDARLFRDGDSPSNKAKNKIHLFKEQLTELLIATKAVSWFEESCDTLKEKNKLNPEEYGLLREKEKIYFATNKTLSIHKVIFSLFAEKLKQNTPPSVVYTTLENLAQAFAADYKLRNDIESFASMFVRIGGGADHTMIVLDGAIYGFGRNQYGQLGFGHTYNVRTPQKITIETDRPLAPNLN